MNDRRFDALARELVEKQPRRRVVAALGGWIALRPGRPDRALACVRLGRKCHNNGDCCHGAWCRRRKCRCNGREKFINCFGTCTHLNTEPHCAACGDSCAAGETCCNGVCVDLVHDPDHCGGCQNRCPGNGPRCCSDGVCVEDLQSNHDHCGACDHACAAGDVCCDGACVGPLPDNPNHCGRCGRACAAGEGCCDGACVDRENDRSNCGRCGRVCDSTAICTNGTCLSCPPGRVVCGNVCCLP